MNQVVRSRGFTSTKFVIGTLMHEFNGNMFFNDFMIS